MALFSSQPLPVIARRLGRSVHAVECRLSRLRKQQQQAREPRADYSLIDLAFNFGVHHSTVRRWATHGELTGSQHPVTRQWTFSYAQVARFVHDHSDLAAAGLGPRGFWVLQAMRDAALYAHPPKGGKAGAA